MRSAIINSAAFAFTLNLLGCHKEPDPPDYNVQPASEVLIGTHQGLSFFLNQGGRDNARIETGERLMVVIRLESHLVPGMHRSDGASQYLPQFFGIHAFRGICDNDTGQVRGCPIFRPVNGVQVNVINEYAQRFRRGQAELENLTDNSLSNLPDILRYQEDRSSPVISSQSALRDLMIKFLIGNRRNLVSEPHYSKFVSLLDAYTRLFYTSVRSNDASAGNADPSSADNTLYATLLSLVREQIQANDFQGVGNTLNTVTDLVKRGGVGEGDVDTLKRIVLPFILGRENVDIREYGPLFLLYGARSLGAASEQRFFDGTAR